jgi:hypothetical protein
MQYVATRSFKTERYNFEAGHMIPARLNTPMGRRFLKDKYGADVITEVDPDNPQKLLAIFAKDGLDPAQFVQLKQLCQKQAGELVELKRENEKLKKRVQQLTAS